MDKSLLAFLDEVFDIVRFQLEEDQKRWGNTWKYRTCEGQEERIFSRYRDYYDQYKNACIPIPWGKVIGEAVVAIVRLNHPEELIKED
jgi:hypothetical protein